MLACDVLFLPVGEVHCQSGFQSVQYLEILGRNSDTDCSAHLRVVYLLCFFGLCEHTSVHPIMKSFSWIIHTRLPCKYSGARRQLTGTKILDLRTFLNKDENCILTVILLGFEYAHLKINKTKTYFLAVYKAFNNVIVNWLQILHTFRKCNSIFR